MKSGINHKLDWYVVRTAPLMEWRAADKLRTAGYEVYLPTMRVERKNRRTHTYSTKERALMPGYLFLGTAGSLYRAVNCFGVEGVLSNGGYVGKRSGGDGDPIRISSDLVETIYLAEIDMQFDDTRVARIYREEEGKTRRLTVAMQFSKGEEGRVSSGPFAGFSGVIENVTHQGMVEMLLNLFGRATLATFDPRELAGGEKFPKAS
ncbi:transcription termination/antitermination NusG family protein [Shinella yambaruensis]|uniref:transcription termination/antitermination protein NusG n=1 Tax=Shinella yambaruensis TaxID=415996 RepID=UPI003D7BE14A